MHHYWHTELYNFSQIDLLTYKCAKIMQQQQIFFGSYNLSTTMLKGSECSFVCAARPKASISIFHALLFIQFITIYRCLYPADYGLRTCPCVCVYLLQPLCKIYKLRSVCVRSFTVRLHMYCFHFGRYMFDSTNGWILICLHKTSHHMSRIFNIFTIK